MRSVDAPGTEPLRRAPARLVVLGLALGGVLGLAWPQLRGPPAGSAPRGWVSVVAGPRLDLTPTVVARPAGPDEDPTSWSVLQGSFVPLREAELDGPTWLHVRLHNPAARPYHGVLALQATLAPTFEVFTRSGDRFVAGSSERLHRIPVFAVAIEAGRPLDVLVRVHAPRGRAPLELWHADAFTDAATRADWALGVLLGLIFAVALYYLGNALLLRDASYAPFVMLLLASSAQGYVALGYAYAHWGDGALDWSRAASPVALVALAAATWFTRRFLEVARTHPGWAGGFRGLEWGLVILAGFALVGVPMSRSLHALLVIVTATLALGFSVLRSVEGVGYARVFGLGWVPFAIASAAAVGAVPGDNMPDPLLVVSAAAAVLTFGFAVADRVALLRDTREAALRESQERYAFAVRGAHDGLFDCNFDTGSAFLSPRFFETLRLPEDAIDHKASALLELVHPEDREIMRRAVLARFADETQDDLQLECRGLFGDHSVRWVLMRALLVRREGRVIRLVGSITDIHTRKLNELKLQRRAFSDEITKLPNRARVLQHIETLLELHREEESFSFGVLFIDVDRFKNVNDSLGHAAGDSMLATLGRRLALVARDEDLVGRLGGDEFVLVLAGRLTVADLERVARRVLEALEAPVMLEGLELRPSASIGITHSDVGYTSVKMILEDADVAMYEAKRRGKGRYVTFDAAMRTQVREHLELESELRRERGEFEVYYQPIIRAEDRGLAGFEALLRWKHPERGIVSPALFIPLAEETGVIRRLGRFILFAATQQLAEWQRRIPGAEDWFVTVNVSPAQFGHDLLEEVGEALDQAELEPKRLKLEITEGLYINDAGPVKAEMKSIADAGVGFSLDDFGTGFSSLSYLHDLPFGTLKVDRSFMRNLLDDNQSEAIVKSVLELGRGLRMETVAEGVETAEVADRLGTLGTTYFQGYFFGRPLPPSELEEQLRSAGFIARRTA